MEIAMRKKIICALSTLTLILGFTIAALGGAMQSDNYRIPSSVISSGGTSIESANYQMTSTFGQSSATGKSSTSSYINYAGFWQPTELNVKGKAMPWIPLLLLDE
jgi:hypothetical protein